MVSRRHVISGALGLGVAAAVPLGTTGAAAAAALPAMLPAPQSWAPAASGSFSFATGRIVVDSAYAGALADDGQTFADDLAAIAGVRHQVLVAAASSAVAGDIVLTLAGGSGIAAEGHRIEIGSVTTVRGSTATGVFWGTRTLLQFFRQTVLLPYGIVTDAPKYPVRAVLVSPGQSMTFWFNLIRNMAYLKLNELVVGAIGFVPQAGAAQVQQLEAFAARYHVRLVGWINSPKWQAYESVPAGYRLTDVNGAVSLNNVDPSVPGTTDWVKSRLGPILDRFSGGLFHLGGDEWPNVPSGGILNVNGVTSANYRGLLDRSVAAWNDGSPGSVEDTYRTYFNDLHSFAASHGKRVRMWNDEIFPASKVQLSPDIDIDYWVGRPGTLTPTQLAAAGHKLINCNFAYLYFERTTAQKLWEQFNPGLFPGPDGTTQTQTLPGGANDPAIAGLRLCVWSGFTSAQVERGLLAKNQALAQQAWGSPRASSTWAGIQPTLVAVGEAPGVFGVPSGGIGAVTGAPAIDYNGGLYSYFSGSDGSLNLRRQAGTVTGSILAQTILPAGSVVGTPVSQLGPSGVMNVLARSSSGNVIRRFWTSATQSWATEDLTAKAAALGNPSLTSTSDLAAGCTGSVLHVFGRSAAGNLLHWWHNSGNGWYGANNWGDLLTGNPVALSWGDTIVVFSRGSDGLLHLVWQDAVDPGHAHFRTLPVAVIAGGNIAAWTNQDQQLVAVTSDPNGRILRWSHDLATAAESVQDLTTATGLVMRGSPAGAMLGTSEMIVVRRSSDSHLFVITHAADGTTSARDWSALTDNQATLANPVAVSFSAQLHAFSAVSGAPRRHWWGNTTGTVQVNSWP